MNFTFRLIKLGYTEVVAYDILAQLDRFTIFSGFQQSENSRFKKDHAYMIITRVHFYMCGALNFPTISNSSFLLFK
jgi:hypothetical protein